MKKIALSACTVLIGFFSAAQNVNISGNIATHTTWDTINIDTVKVTGNITVDSLVVLTIKPGIVVDFTGDYFLNIKGGVVARGTAADSITFTTSDTTGFYNNTHVGWAGIRIHDRRYSGDTTCLDYCIIEYGKADGSALLPNSTHGGGLYTYSSWKVKLTNSSFRHNYALGNGGAYWDYYSFVNNGPQQYIVNCNFINNVCAGTTTGGGGAIFTSRSYNLKFINNVFARNRTIDGRGGALCNGPYNGYNSYVNIDRSRFSYNQSENGNGGAVSLLQNSEHTISRSLFHNNSAPNGGALFINQTIAKLQNNVLVNNEAASSGGAIYFFNVFSDGGGTSVVANNTIAHNKAVRGGGIYVYDGLGGGSIAQAPNLYINKVIFYNNETTTSLANEDIGMGASANSNHTRFYSCSFTSDLNNTGVSVFMLVDHGNLHYTNPLFVAPSAGAGLLFNGAAGTDWSLDCASPCADKPGIVLYTPEPFDYRGTPRQINGAVDIGAYEAYGILTQPQNLEICEGDTAVFNSTYYDPTTNLSDSYWHISPDNGSNWFAIENNAESLMLSTNTPATSDGLLVTLNYNFGCGNVFTDTVMLTVHPDEFTQNDVAGCDVYFVGGADQTGSGVYYDTLQSVFGCDSIIETTLTIHSSHHFSSTVNICQGDSALVFGRYETVAGSYYDSLLTVNGCDSVYMVSLVVSAHFESTHTHVICAGDSVYAQGGWQQSSGLFYDTLSTAKGCDSVIISAITVKSSSFFTIDTAFCQGDFVTINGVTYTAPGTYHDYLVNAVGCDSVLTIHVTERALPNADIGPDTLWVCDGETLVFGLDTTGIDSYMISNFFSSETNDTFSFVYNMWAPASSVVSQVTGTNGCVNTDQVVLVSNQIVNMAAGFPVINDPTVHFSIANMPSNVDFWYWSFGDGDTLSGETDPMHTYAVNGSYVACLVATNVCGSDSSCATFDIQTVGLEEPEAASFVVYPNPGRRFFNIKNLGKPMSGKLVDASGRTVRIFEISHGVSSFSLENKPPGVYYIIGNSEGLLLKRKMVVIPE